MGAAVARIAEQALAAKVDDHRTVRDGERVAGVLEAAARHGGHLEARLLQQRLEQRVELEAETPTMAADDLVEHVGYAQRHVEFVVVDVQILEGDAALMRVDDPIQQLAGELALGRLHAQLLPVQAPVRQRFVQLLEHSASFFLPFL